MLRGSFVATLLVASLLAAPGIGTAQYMYLDANGDGVNTAADVLNASGPDSIDIWLDTTHDRDGSAQTCNSHSGAPTGGAALDFFSYTIILQAVGGTVTWGTFAAADPEYTLLGTDLADDHDTEFNRARPAGTVTPPGLTKLGTIPVEVVSGSPSVRIGTSTPVDPSAFGTGFGTNCEGNNFLNTYVLATPDDSSGDWFDTDGVRAPGTNALPSISAPASVTAAAFVPLTISATATDPDQGDVLTIGASGAPGSLALSSSPGPSPNTATLSGTPTAAEASGSPYSVLWAVNDGAGGNASTTTSLTVTRDETPPVVTAPDSARASETIAFTLGISASDPEGDPINSLTASPLPAGATFTPSAFNTAGNLQWTPALGTQGMYPVTFTAMSGSPPLSGSKTTVIVVGPRDRRPVVTAPASVTVNEGQALTVTATANDPDGDPIISFVASGTQNTPLPPGVTYSVNGTNTTMMIQWTPTFTQAGIYNLDLEATSSGFLGPQISVAFILKITVRNTDRAPVVTAPGTASGQEGVPLSVTVTASDPDGNAITTLGASPLPAGATFSADPGNTSGTLSWTPDFTQEGAYDVTFTASNLLPGSASTHITIAHGNALPALSAPPSLSVDEGTPLTFSVSATDGDGDHVTLSAPSRPLGAGFTDHGDNTGTFDWTPGFGQVGTYTVTFAGNDGHGGVATATTAISVQNVNRAPVANPGGPYSGLTNVPVSFTGTGSSDPDGDPLTYAWDFGDGMTGTGATPNHVYTAAGSYTVDLTVQDNGTPPLSASASTTATITAVLTPRIYLTGNATIKLGTGKPTWCAQVEPVGSNFALADVRVETLVMKYGAGQILADPRKTGVGGDKDGNGIAEIGACFSKPNLRTLFAGLPPGKSTVTVTLEADLQGGGKVSGSIEVEVQNSGGSALTASVSPNPLNPSTILTFSISKPGPVQVRLYDLAGRLVRTLADDVYATAGYHDLRIDGRGESGERLPSGVYFYSIKTVEGAAHGRLTILK